MNLPDGGKKRGKQAERDVMMACQAIVRNAAWALNARYATPQEDRRGIDIVVESDRGDLCLQVKASKRAGWRREGVTTALVVANPLEGLDVRTRKALVGLYVALCPTCKLMRVTRCLACADVERVSVALAGATVSYGDITVSFSSGETLSIPYVHSESRAALASRIQKAASDYVKAQGNKEDGAR